MTDTGQQLHEPQTALRRHEPASRRRWFLVCDGRTSSVTFDDRAVAVQVADFLARGGHEVAVEEQ